MDEKRLQPLLLQTAHALPAVTGVAPSRYHKQHSILHPPSRAPPGHSGSRRCSGRGTAGTQPEPSWATGGRSLTRATEPTPLTKAAHHSQIIHWHWELSETAVLSRKETTDHRAPRGTRTPPSHREHSKAEEQPGKTQALTFLGTS